MAAVREWLSPRGGFSRGLQIGAAKERPSSASIARKNRSRTAFSVPQHEQLEVGVELDVRGKPDENGPLFAPLPLEPP
jgi:hypothetical protein